MQSIEQTGKTEKEAVELALKELGVSRDKVEVEVLSGGQAGLFGLLKPKEVEVRVTIIEDKLSQAKEWLEKILGAMNRSAKVVRTSEEEREYLDIQGEESGIIIGKYGQCLEALETLVNAIVSKGGKVERRVSLDTQGYRKRREKALIERILRIAEQVKKTGEEVDLEAMTSYERRVVHLALHDNPEVTTISRGEGRERRVVISPREGGDTSQIS